MLSALGPRHTDNITENSSIYVPIQDISGRSFIPIMNCIGQKTDHWVTPDTTGTGSEA